MCLAELLPFDTLPLSIYYVLLLLVIKLSMTVMDDMGFPMAMLDNPPVPKAVQSAFAGAGLRALSDIH